MQPVGELLGEKSYQAGGLPAIIVELLDAGKLNIDVMTWDRRMIWTYDNPLFPDAGFLHLRCTGE
ncbi:hypothetical protein BO70DRAFT_359269 [Aspergillus heteromorphus CBS 117.55]|uniref:Uncharacterized protein n=1 Tax=Aspergillus heteromorphus CBS 117.55 TaxID=1448321 RepID=A0A317WXJ8_9EURO|nr:uncharacterized protein BO70DRAFT_359269 [Aspergillus heteromorphus CBS 117.55]PWY88970.1 hypothetical protein BO70DRAFT_359269 [Aspergillus heteromorphus CBS 117.55]